MLSPYYCIIKESYRAVLRNWSKAEIEEQRNSRKILQEAASLASVLADTQIDENDVSSIIGKEVNVMALNK